jgi:hypothetical protein
VIYIRALLFSVVICGLVSCGRTLPKSYGIYAESESGLERLPGQQIVLRGSLFSAVGGIEGPSGIHCKELKSFVVFKQDVKADSIKLTRVDFKSEMTVRDMFAARAIDVKLWIPSTPINIDIKPVDGHPDMLYVMPSAPLGNGLYVLYFNSFGDLSAPTQNIAYDIVVGNLSDFPSYAAKVAQAKQEIRPQADKLLAAMNHIFNEKDYVRLREVYRPNGSELSGNELKSFTDGMQTWRNTAGSIESSKIVSEEISESGEAGTFDLDTTYEKSGMQREELQIRKFPEGFFVTSLK